MFDMRARHVRRNLHIRERGHSAYVTRLKNHTNVRRRRVRLPRNAPRVMRREKKNRELNRQKTPWRNRDDFPRLSLISAFKWEKYLHIGLHAACRAPDPMGPGPDRSPRAPPGISASGTGDGRRMERARAVGEVENRLEAPREGPAPPGHCHSNDLYARLKLGRPCKKPREASPPARFSPPPLLPS